MRGKVERETQRVEVGVNGFTDRRTERQKENNRETAADRNEQRCTDRLNRTRRYKQTEQKKEIPTDGIEEK